MTAAAIEQARNRIENELPYNARWLIHGTPLDFDFSRSQHTLQPLSPSEVHCTIEKESETLYLFGKQDYAEGGGATPYLGVDSLTGEVRGLDIERDTNCLFLLNSDIDAFIKTFTLFDNALRLGTLSLDAVLEAATAIDRQAFKQTEWAKLLEYLLDRDQ